MDCSVLVLSLGATQILLVTGSNRTEEVPLLHRQTLDPPFSSIKCTGEETSEHVVTKGQRDRLAAYSTVDVLKVQITLTTVTLLTRTARVSLQT